MKKILLSLFLCLFLSVSHAQQDKYIYLDSLGQETKPGNHKTHKIIKNYKTKQKTYNVYEYYLSGALKSEGIYSDNNAKIKEGFFTNYYENGKVKSRLLYTENTAYGDFTSWHENGNKKTEGEYIIDNYSKFIRSDLKINNSWDENNNPEIVNGNGMYNEVEGLQSAKGELKNGFKTNLWEGRTKVGNLTFKETYKNGKLIEGTSVDSLNKTYSYKEIDKQAGPEKGMNDFYKQVASKIVVPEVSSDITSIKMMASFIIDSEGKIRDIEIVRGYNPKLEDSFIKALTKSPNWHPAYHRGKAVKSKFFLPLTIQIDTNNTHNPERLQGSRRRR